MRHWLGAHALNYPCHSGCPDDCCTPDGNCQEGVIRRRAARQRRVPPLHSHQALHQYRPTPVPLLQQLYEKYACTQARRCMRRLASRSLACLSCGHRVHLEMCQAFQHCGVTVFHIRAGGC